MQFVLRRYATTLHLSRPFGRTGLLALVLLLGVIGITEALLQIPAVRDPLPLVPSIGSNHRAFEVKLHLLDKLTAEHPLDCVFFGSSITDRGLTPVSFETAYQAQTGVALHCFNLGVGGAGEMTGLILSPIVIADYDPSLLVFGISPRLHTQGPVGAEITDLPWYHNKIGDFSPEGWLALHSEAYRYGLSAMNWLNSVALDRETVQDMERYGGISPTDAVMTLPLSSRDQGRLERSHFRLMADDRTRLERMMALYDPPRRQVVIVEVPMHPIVFEHNAAFDQQYDTWAAEVTALTAAHGVVFWPTTKLNLVPEMTAWEDFNHLNTTGSLQFSAWLGAQVGQAVQDGRLAVPASR